MASIFENIPLVVQKMNESSRKMFNNTLHKYHDSLVHDPQYNEYKEDAIIRLGGDEVFGPCHNYYVSISNIADSRFISAEYIDYAINRHFKNNMDILGNENCTVYVSKIDKINLIDTLGCIHYLFSTFDQDIPIRIYEPDIAIIGEENSCVSVDTEVTGQVSNEGSLIAPVLTMDKRLALIYEKENGTGSLMAVSGNFIVVTVSTANDDEVIIIPENLWNEYNDKPFIKIIDKLEMEEDTTTIQPTGLISQQIAPFSQIENNIELPLQIMDTITSKLKYKDNVQFSNVLKDLYSLGDVAKFARTAVGLMYKYTNSCIFVNKEYDEWEVTDILSAFFNLSSILGDALMMISNFGSVEVKVYANKGDDNSTTAIVVSVPEKSSINYSNCGEKFTEVRHYKDVKEIDIVFHNRSENSKVVSMYDPYLCVKSSGPEWRLIKLPSTGYKTLMESKIDMPTGEAIVVGVAIYRIQDFPMIQMMRDPSAEDFV